jgi:hypothetical protein
MIYRPEGILERLFQFPGILSQRPDDAIGGKIALRLGLGYPTSSEMSQR